MTREDFLVYMDHFNNMRYDELVKYFTDDIQVKYFTDMKRGAPRGDIADGPAAFVANYKQLHSTLIEKLELGKYVATDENIFCELWTEFHFTKDNPDFSAGPMKKGDVFVCTNFVLYFLDENGKFKEIHIAHHLVHPPSEARLA
ncbi:MAG: hypothetical protein FWH32_00730 [Clostridiales bacterium]|nr:hypothetical protein [Clostridiales bacterium]